MSTKKFTVRDVYDIFTKLVESNQWTNPEYIELYEDLWYTFFSLARDSFIYPRVSLDLDAEGNFVDENITERELNILALGMVYQWSSQVGNSTDFTDLGYTERDWSKTSAGAHLRQVINLGKEKESQYKTALSNYYRSHRGRPDSVFGNLAGHEDRRRG